MVIEIRCPLCSALENAPVEEIRHRDVWEGLRKEWGADFSTDVISKHTLSESIFLVKCKECGLHYFNPAVPGGPDFYDQLSKSKKYYVQEKWEFGVVKEQLDFTYSVLDVGCGEGQFLAQVKDHIKVATGIDTNPEGIIRAKEKGVDAREESIEVFSKKHVECYDVVCVFQVAEHLSDVTPFLKLALACVKPGGQLVVSVPNSKRLKSGALEPLDCPPHHISRWEADQLDYLGDRLGVTKELVRFDAVGISQARAAMRAKIVTVLGGNDTVFSGVSGLLGRLAARLVFSPSLYRVYRQYGLLQKFQLFGHSMVAFYRKP